MGIFKLRKNKKYNYIPRHYDDKGEGRPFEIKHKFDEYRRATGNTSGIKTKFNNVLEEMKEKPDRVANRRILIIVAVLILIFLFVIDFDLSIFFSKN